MLSRSAARRGRVFRPLSNSLTGVRHKSQPSGRSVIDASPTGLKVKKRTSRATHGARHDSVLLYNSRPCARGFGGTRDRGVTIGEIIGC